MTVKNHRPPLSFLTSITLGLYEFFWHLLLPVVLIRLYWKGRVQRGYRRHILERLGCYKKQLNSTKLVWVHAVSVGETRASAPLVQALLADGYQVLLTHMTPTGRQTGQEIFSKAITTHQLQQAYLPYDISWAVKAFLKKFQPKLGLVMETEVWPILLRTSVKANVPLLLVNARLSERSARKTLRFGNLAADIYRSFSQILAQTPLDAKRYESLGLGQVMVTGNLKFDVAPNFSQIDEAVSLRKNLAPEMQIVCAASTRDGEEKIVIDAWTELMKSQPELAKVARLIVVPRHPQRFEEAFQVLQTGAPLVAKKSQLADELALVEALNNQAIILGDSMGEMSFYYALSDVVVMGGSLRPLGGQNFIEASSLGCPAILGEHTFNFQQASQDVIDAHAAIRVANVDDLAKAMGLLLSDKNLRETMSANAIDFSSQHMGATEKIMDVVRQY